jgi:hypothetical protein
LLADEDRERLDARAGVAIGAGRIAIAYQDLDRGEAIVLVEFVEA